MASAVTKFPVFTAVTKRSYAAAQAAASPQVSYSLPPQKAQTSTLPNGIIVTSLENHAPVARVGLAFKAGSRYETAETAGASHYLRACTGLSTKNMTSFLITRLTQQLGGSISCEGGREHLLYSLNVIRDDLPKGMEILKEVGTQTLFRHWEVPAVQPRLSVELATRDPTTRVVELLHSAAFRNLGLGNSIYVAEGQEGNMKLKKLEDFRAATHTTGRLVVVGLGMDHESLTSFANELDVPAGAGAAPNLGKYEGGEVRCHTGCPVAYVAVAGQGASFGSHDVAALAVAEAILGMGPGTKYGSNASSKLAVAAGGDGAVSAFSMNYSDSGLFGYFIAADADKAGKVVSSVHAAVKNLKVSAADITQGKKRAQAAAYAAYESGDKFISDIGVQSLMTGTFTNAESFAAAVDAVTAADVENALKKVSSGKLSMGAIGGLQNVPYLDKL